MVDSQHALEVGMVGREGMVGISYALGVRRSPVRALVHGAGTAMRMSASRFRIQFRQSERLQRLVYLHTGFAVADRRNGCVQSIPYDRSPFGALAAHDARSTG